MNGSRLLVSLSAWLLTNVAAAQCESQWLQGEAIGLLAGDIYDTATWDPDGAGPAAPRLVVAGVITGGQVYNGSIAAWDGSQWLRLGTPPSGYGQSVAVWNGNLVAVFVAPSFTSSTVASWNGGSWQVMGTFDGNSTTAAYATLAVHQGNLYVGGNFTHFNGVPIPNVVHWNGSSWALAGSSAPNPVREMVSFQNVLYAAAGQQLVTWNGSGWTVVASGNGSITALAVRNAVSVTNTYLYVAGAFSQWTGANGTVAGPIVRFSPATASWSGLGFSSVPPVYDLAVRPTGISTAEVVAVNDTGLWQQSGSSWVQLGGQLFGFSSAPRKVIYHGAAWHVCGTPSSLVYPVQRLQGGAWVYLLPTGSSLGPVRAARASGAETVVGGTFGLRQGQPGAWNPVGGLTGQVDEITRMANGDLVVAGTFTAPGLPPNGLGLARWNGAAWSWLGATNGLVRALQPMPDGSLFVGGDFTTIGGVSAAYVARRVGGTWQPLGAGVNGIVRAMTPLPNGDLVVGGDFTLAGGFANPASYVARWNGATWTPMSGPSPARSLTTEVDGTVVALMDQARRWFAGAWQLVRPTNADAVLALPDRDLCFAGGGAVVRTDAAGVVRSSFVCPYPISDLVLAEDGDLIVAGDIVGVAAGGGVAGVASVGVARLDAPCAATSTVGGAGCTGSAGPLTLAPTALPWLGATFRAVATGLPLFAFGVTVTGFAPTGLPLLAAFPTAVPGCTLHVQPDLLEVALAAGGAVSVQLAVPNNPALVGITVHHQVVSLQFDAALNFTQVAATNSLQSTVGTL